MNLCVTHYQVYPTSSHQYLEALKKHVILHKDISTAFFYLWYKIYRNEYLTVVNDMDWIPCLQELSNHICFDHVGSIIMNNKDVGNENAGRGNVYFERGKASAQFQKSQKGFLGCLFHMTVEWTIN